VGPACQWQCRAAPSPDWLPWVALSRHTRGGLNALPTAPRPPPDSLARSPRPSRRRPDSHPPPDSRSPAHLALRATVPTASRPDRHGPKPPSPGPSPCHPTPPSTPSCRAAVHAPVSCATFLRSSPVRRWGAAVRQPRRSCGSRTQAAPAP
jgi:hypothetical protein